MPLWINIKLNMYSIHLNSSVIVGGTSPKSASQHEQAITSHAIIPSHNEHNIGV